MAAKPEHLYAWTDSSITETTYYAWKREYDNYCYYTTTETPTTSDKVYYNYNDSIEEETEYVGINEYDSSTNPPRAKIHDMMDWDWFYRDSSSDKTLYTTPRTVYTDSTTLTNGMTLYNNTGTDTGYQVSKNSNSNFELGQYSVSFVISNMVTNFTLDGITYTTNTTLKMSEGTHTLSISGTYTSLAIQSTGNVGNSVTVISGVSTTGNYTGSLIISSGNITESTQNYLFGTCPITLTFEGSMNHGGGSN